MKRFGRLTSALGWLLIAAFALYIEHKLGWRSLLEPWRRVGRWQALFALLLIMSTYLLRSLRQSAYFSKEMGGRFGLSTRLMVWHNFYNNFLPMRAGELSFPLLARRYFGIPYAEAAGALLWFRLLDLWMIGILASLAAALLDLRGLILAAILIPLPCALARAATSIQIYLSHKNAGWAIRCGRLVAAFPQHASRVYSSCFWTAANWIVKLAALAWLLMSFTGIRLPAACVGALSGDLTSVLPVHGPAGLGSYEAGVVAGLLPFDIPIQQAVPAAVALHAVLLGSTGLAALLAALLPCPSEVSRYDRS